MHGILPRCALGAAASLLGLAACAPALDGPGAEYHRRVATDTVVTVTVRGCPLPPQPVTQLRVDVMPVEAHVPQGARFRWVIEGDTIARVRIQHKRGTWPFTAQQFPDTRPGQRIDAGRATQASPNDRSGYYVIVRCRNLEVIIDPDIVIREPDQF